MVTPVTKPNKVGRPTKSELTPEEKTLAARGLVPNIELKTQLEGSRDKVFLDRYSLKDLQGQPTEHYIEEMWQRVAGGIAMMEKTESLRKEWAGKFYEAMQDFKFVPAGRILSGAGTGYEVTFFNCYVIPSPKDSRGGIMENITHTVEIQARGGGVGINLSSLRPSGARVKKVNGTSSGPVSWAKLYSAANHDVIQQGGSRRGALMLMLHDWHPDVLQFVHAKDDGQSIPGANLSICISDKFMEAVKNDGEWITKFPDTSVEGYDELWDGDIEKWEAQGLPIKVYETYKAKEIWDQICTSAWASAEPGLHFLERSNKWSNTWYFEKLLSTNPCGEQPLGEWAVCNLGAMNLSAFVKEDGAFDYEDLDQKVRVAMRFMDNVVDANYYFFDENEKKAKEIRRTGIGTMGIADALIQMKLKYGSDDAMPVIEKIYKTIRDAAYETSTELAKEKGSFPKFDKDKYLEGYFIKQLPESIREKIAKHGIRNAVILTQAPTGTTSLLAGASSGIEPVFDFKFIRKDRIGTHTIYHPLYQKWQEENPEVKEKPDYFVSANDLSPMDHIKVQALIQKYTDSSISKTANAPFEFTVDQVKELYMSAYDLGCKGVTFFRDGSRSGVLYREEEPKKAEEKKEEVVIDPTADPREPRPMILRGTSYETMTPLGKAYITINKDEQGQPFEIFINIGKGGTHTLADAEAIGRMISLALQVAKGNRMAVAKKIAQHLRGIGGGSSIGFGKARVTSLGDAVAKVLSEDIALGESQNQIPLNLPESESAEVNNSLSNGTSNGHATNGHASNGQAAQVDGQVALPLVAVSPDDVMKCASFLQMPTSRQADICPECGAATFVMEEGCSKCYSCGYSKC